MLTIFKNFYSELYKEHCGNTSIQEELLGSITSKLKNDHSPHPAQDLLKQDLIKKTLTLMANNKTPGPDGITVEFYKCFFNDISDIMVDIFTEIFQHGVLPPSMSKAVTVLIPKEGDNNNPSNYRPITLLNTDYKLLTKHINMNYFKNVMPAIISNVQLCTVPGRSIHDGNIFIRDTISYIRNKKLSAILMSLDQQKAFDMVNRHFLLKTMKAMNVHTDIIKFIFTIYSKTETCLEVNGHLSETISLERGVRQGCPLSAALYTIYIQSCISCLFKSKNYKGISLPNNQRAVCTAYADDLLFFCDSVADVETIFSFFDKMYLGTGGKLNKTKTKLLPIGDQTITSEYQTNELKVCGVLFSNSKYNNQVNINTVDITSKVEKKLKRYTNIPCSMRGKILIINTVIFPILFYLAPTFLPNQEFFRQFKTLIFSFLYGEGRREIFKREIIELEKEKGGLGLTDINNKCRAFFLYHNVIQPSCDSFEHPRIALHKFFFSFWCRDIYPQMYKTSEPHCFKIIRPYQQVRESLNMIKNYHDTLKISPVSMNQIYQWLRGDKDDAFVKILRKLNHNKELPGRLFDTWRDSVLPVPLIDFMWRLAFEGLKTGEYIKKLKIPKATLTCAFCDECQIETTVHLFSECKTLFPHRTSVLKIISKLNLYETHNIQSNEIALLFCTGVLQSPTQRYDKRKLFKIVATLNKAVWDSRNAIRFNSSTATAELKKLDAIIKNLHFDNNKNNRDTEVDGE